VNIDLEVRRQEMVKSRERVLLELAPSLAVPWARDESHFFSAFPLRAFERTPISNLHGSLGIPWMPMLANCRARPNAACTTRLWTFCDRELPCPIVPTLKLSRFTGKSFPDDFA
jgi:hypothetical protein